MHPRHMASRHFKCLQIAGRLEDVDRAAIHAAARL